MLTSPSWAPKRKIFKPWPCCASASTSRLKPPAWKRNERIRAEETAKLQAQAAIEAAAKTEAPSEQPEPVVELKATETVSLQSQAAHENEAANGGDTLALGQINALLAPLKIDAAGLEQLSFHPSKTVSTARRYAAHQLPAMVQAMVTTYRAFSPLHKP